MNALFSMFARNTPHWARLSNILNSVYRPTPGDLADLGLDDVPRKNDKGLIPKA